MQSPEHRAGVTASSRGYCSEGSLLQFRTRRQGAPLPWKPPHPLTVVRPLPNSASCGSLEKGPRGSMYTTEIGQLHKATIFFFHCVAIIYSPAPLWIHRRQLSGKHVDSTEELGGRGEPRARPVALKSRSPSVFTHGRCHRPEHRAGTVESELDLNSPILQTGARRLPLGRGPAHPQRGIGGRARLPQQPCQPGCPLHPSARPSRPPPWTQRQQEAGDRSERGRGPPGLRLGRRQSRRQCLCGASSPGMCVFPQEPYKPNQTEERLKPQRNPGC